MEIAYYLGKFLVGRTLAVIFAGIFSAAPSVLLASLLTTILFKGAAPAGEHATATGSLRPVRHRDA